MAASALDDWTLDRLFREARTHSTWRAEPVTDEQLRQAWSLAVMGPTSANCLPARIVFVRTAEGRAKLRPTLSAGNVAKTMAAPVTAIVAHDLAFHDRLPWLFPQAPAREWFAGNPEFAATTAFRNGSLQAGYLILACRAMGLDCGPMSGFDAAAVDLAFFAGTTSRSNLLINIGHGDPAALAPRAPRLGFDEACSLA